MRKSAIIGLLVAVLGTAASCGVAYLTFDWNVRAWHDDAVRAARALSDTVLTWIESSFADLSALDEVIENAPDIGRSQFLNLVDDLESRSTVDFMSEKALLERQGEHWTIRYSSAGSANVLIGPDKAEATIGWLGSAIAHASVHPNEWVISKPIKVEGAPAAIFVLLPLRSNPNEILLGVLDIERIMEEIMAIRATEGVYPVIDVDALDGQSDVPAFQRAPPMRPLETVSHRLRVGNADLVAVWSFTDDFSGGRNDWIAVVIAAGGTFASLLIGWIAWHLLEQNRIVRVEVDKATLSLSRERSLLRSLIDTIPDFISVKDGAGAILVVNRAFAAFLGRKPDALVGKTLFDIFPTAVAKSRHDQDLRVLESSKKLAFEEPWSSPDGRVVVIDGAKLPFKDVDGSSIGVISVGRDITRRKEAEEALRLAKETAEEATRAKANFLATMSHEIRTPMNGVVSMAQLLDQTRLTSEQKDLTKTIRQSADALLTVINDILDFSRIEAGKLPIEKIRFDLLDVVEGALDLLAPKAEEKSLKLLFHLEPGLPMEAIGDPSRLRQILLNLGSNAVKFTRAGRVELRAAIAERSGSEMRLRFEVRDSGIGLTAEQQANLFRPFGQADSSTSRRFGGTGLGLSICKNLCELMGGAIGVSSAIEKGSTFWFELPMGTEGCPELRPRFDIGSARVMMAGYEPDEAETVEAMLSAGGVTAVLSLKEIARLTEDTLAGFAPDLALINGRAGVPTVNQWAGRLRSLKARQATVVTAPHLAASALGLTQQSLGGLDLLGTMALPVHARKLWDYVAVAHKRADRSVLSETSEESATYEAPSIELARTHNAVVLVAEDNDTNQKVISRVLSRQGIAHEIADNGKIALEMMAQHPYGMLLSDFHMPEMDGFELTRTLRQREGESGARRLPIIALTADVLPGTEPLCVEAGMDGYLSKPINFAALAAAIRTWLPQAEALRKEKRPEGEEPAAAVEPPASPAAPPTPDGAQDLASLIGRQDKHVIDLAILLETIGELDREMADLMFGVVDGLVGNTAKLMAALAEQDGRAARSVAHAMKGTTRSMGAVEIGQVFERIQDAIDRRDFDQARSAAAELEPARRRLVDETKDMRRYFAAAGGE
jgi:PAS domain S-box-containing protein